MNFSWKSLPKLKERRRTKKSKRNDNILKKKYSSEAAAAITSEEKKNTEVENKISEVGKVLEKRKENVSIIKCILCEKKEKLHILEV